ncbi:RloB family protein [Polymorphospora rubra]|uniref:RloB family protein n=1 Tax=Polymorphospora rubra TaxID=338584 RepID=UPI00340FA636
MFYVAVEGESTEPDYLTYLNREFGAEHQFLIHPLYKRNGMTPGRVVDRALEQRDEIAGDDARAQLWALFDRDQHRDIPKALRDARAGGVRIAFSNPSFDLWLLLHFTDVSGQQNGSSRVVHSKLRQQPGFETFGVRNDKVSLVPGPRLWPGGVPPRSGGRRGWSTTVRTGRARPSRGTRPTAIRYVGIPQRTSGNS